MRTAYSYLRFSTAEQLKGDSLRRQGSEAERACAQFKWQLSALSFRDLGTSAFRGRNRTKGRLADSVDPSVSPGSIVS
jgi:DNA invertase Pin-like site-specific DNA recombinase